MKAVTKFTFNKECSVERCVVKNAVGEYAMWYKYNGDIIFESNYVACPRIAYCVVDDDDFIFDLGNNDIKDFVQNFFPTNWQTEVTEQPMSLFKNSVKKDYQLKHIKFIENWSKVIVHPDGTFEKEDYPLKPYSVPLKDAYDIVHALLIKYKGYVKKFISEGVFIPTLTGGVDTRCLTALWRDNNLKDFYLKDIKPDGKNRVDLSTADKQCALQVAERIGLANQRQSLETELVTLSGMYTESTRGMYKMNLNDQDFIYKFIQHQIRSPRLLCPFADDLFLQIKHPNKDVFRCLLALLLCPDLLDIKFIGTQKTFEKHNNQPYDFFEEYKDAIIEAREIIGYWGEEKCKRILEE